MKLFAIVTLFGLSAFAADLPIGPTAEERHILKCLAKENGEFYCVRVFSDRSQLDPADIDLAEVLAAEQVALTGQPTEVRNFKCGVTAHCEIIGTNPKTGEVYIECRCGG